ncbi:MAG TPA: HAMP domain-containing sensor histidine kinase [Acidimicrobiales bacterium]|nr:HAMP domain-containing sensor histidine kinase [Acidimicrobiales bacterium]
MSLRNRVLAAVAVVAIVLALVMAVITRNTRANLIGQVDAQLTSAIGPVRSYGLEPAPRPAGRGDSAAPARRLTSLYVGVLDAGTVRTLVAPNLRELPLPAIGAEEVAVAARSGRAFTVDSAGPGPRYRALAYTDLRARAVIVLALPIDSVDQAIARLIAVQLLGAAAILAALGLVAWWVIHLGVRPLGRMSEVAASIAAGDMSRRVPETDPETEAGQLGAALNRMLEQIDSAFSERDRVEDRLRQFVADASHELRTPVATVRGYAELYRSGGLRGTGELDDAMRRTEQESVRMGGLVDDLLQLARLDQNRVLESAPVDLTALARDAAADARAVDRERHIDFDDPTGPVVVHGDEARLRQVLANLIGNAIVHTPPGSAIEIATRLEGSTAVLTVTDQGPGMPADAAARAFERFYRADPARARHRGGSGLGLSIVQAVVEAHGGKVRLTSRPETGTAVRVELPAPTL